jgi:cell division protein FtsQ
MRVMRPRLSRRNRRIAARTGRDAQSRLRLRALVRRAATSALALVAVVGAAVAVAWGFEAVATSSPMQVKHIELTGNTRVSAAEVAAYTGVKEGAKLISVDLDAVALQLRRHPWIASARVRRRLPDELLIEVQEYQPAILVSLGDLYVADAQGIPFKRFAAADALDLPVVTGLSRDEAARRPEESHAHIKDAIELRRAFASQAPTGLRLDELHFDRDLGWSLFITPSGDESLAYRMFLGFAPGARLTAALAAVARVEESGGRPAIVYADGEKNPARVQVHLRGNAASVDRTFVAQAR